MISLIFLIFYTRKITITPRDLPYLLPSFGFFEGGSVEFKLQVDNDYQDQEIGVMLLAEKDINLFYTPKCNSKIDHFKKIVKMVNKTNIANGSVHSNVVLSPYVVGCDDMNYKKLTIEVSTRNPNTYLDSREIPSLAILPVVISVAGLIAVVWSSYLIYRRKHVSKLQVCFTLCLAAFVACTILDYIALRKRSKTNTNELISMVFDIVEALYSSCLVSTIIVATSGWCLICISMEWHEIFITILSPLVFFAAEFASHFSTKVTYDAVCLLFMTGGFIGTCWQLYHNYKRANNTIIAHLMIIAQGGLDPTTTPIYTKQKIFRSLLYFFVIASSVFFVSLALVMFFFDASYLHRLLFDAYQIILYTGIAVIYRPRGRVVDDVLNVASEDFVGVERSDVALEELDMSVLKPNGKARWIPGERLPPEPRIRQRIHSEVPLLSQVGLGGSLMEDDFLE